MRRLPDYSDINRRERAEKAQQAKQNEPAKQVDDGKPNDATEKVGDASKNEPHGDRGRAIEKAKRRICKLKKDMEGAPKLERKRIAKKIERIWKDAERKSKGETHHRGQ